LIVDRELVIRLSQGYGATSGWEQSVERRKSRISKSVLIRVIRGTGLSMCRNIKTLHNFSPPATDDEIRASSLQFVRKLCGFTKPSRANEEAFNHAVDRVTLIAHELLDSLVTNVPPRVRENEVMKARLRSAKRFGTTLAISSRS